MRDHPSSVVGLPITREPHDEPLTPGLRRADLPDRIGFHVGILPDNENDE